AARLHAARARTSSHRPCRPPPRRRTGTSRRRRACPRKPHEGPRASRYELATRPSTNAHILDDWRGGRSVRIAIVGAGAMGSVYAGILGDAGHEVWAVDVWADHVDAIRTRGLTVE